MGIFSFVGGLFGGGAQKRGATKAAAAQIDAANKGIAEQARQYDQSRADFMPYLSAGTGALSQMSGLLGLGGGDQQTAAIDALEASPMFGSLVRNGEEALLQNASATGGIRGGNTQRGLADFRSDVLSQLVQQQLANLSGLAGMGMGATGSVAQLGANKANATTGLYDSIGDATAMKHNIRAGVNANMWNQAGKFLDEAFGEQLKSGLAKQAGTLAKLGGMF
ncbi:hypothetical protein ASE90_05170 [Sphingomonas sp. Leaf67]|uniref:hypothetical protein n=1 Tax=Sphingomonas sp. Leaf67 TaxID=1736230 RepID=UPI0006FBD627|nr:hypothetical protein [Sphingomonas sp. Leaf67]KQN92120.1 hypothetical protein ASE90_05170 [Sphingomonas sp. Leaf67]